MRFKTVCTYKLITAEGYVTAKEHQGHAHGMHQLLYESAHYSLWVNFCVYERTGEQMVKGGKPSSQGIYIGIYMCIKKGHLEWAWVPGEELTAILDGLQVCAGLCVHFRDPICLWHHDVFSIPLQKWATMSLSAQEQIKSLKSVSQYPLGWNAPAAAPCAGWAAFPSVSFPAHKPFCCCKGWVRPGCRLPTFPLKAFSCRFWIDQDIRVLWFVSRSSPPPPRLHHTDCCTKTNESSVMGSAERCTAVCGQMEGYARF